MRNFIVQNHIIFNYLFKIILLLGIEKQDGLGEKIVFWENILRYFRTDLLILEKINYKIRLTIKKRNKRRAKRIGVRLTPDNSQKTLVELSFLISYYTLILDKNQDIC